MWHARDKCVLFEYCSPDSRKGESLPKQVSTHLREIIRSFRQLFKLAADLEPVLI